MNMIEAVRSALRQYVSIQGRARMSEYWWFQLAFAIVTTLLYFVAMVVLVSTALATSNQAVTSGSGSSTPGPGFFVALFVFIAVFVAIMPPAISVSIRRLHDTNRSGWFYLLVLIPLGGFVLLVFFLESGTVGPNRFGEDPKGADRHPHVGYYPPQAWSGQPQGALPPGAAAPQPYGPGQPQPGQVQPYGPGQAQPQPYGPGQPQQPYGPGQPQQAQPQPYGPGQPGQAQPYGQPQPDQQPYGPGHPEAERPDHGQRPGDAPAPPR